MADKQKSNAEPPKEITAEATARLAYDLWLRRGCPHGTDELDWYEAERMLKAEGPSTGVATSGQAAVRTASRKPKTRVAGS